MAGFFVYCLHSQAKCCKIHLLSRDREKVVRIELQYRHEWKHVIPYTELLAIRQRLRTFMETDIHAVDGHYRIRSLYFDNLQDKALREKINGVGEREKFRIRCYNENHSVIHLEKKIKRNGLCAKQSADLSEREVRRLLNGDTDWMQDCDRALVRELFLRMQTQGLLPRTLVDYTREPYVYSPGNVRVTFDYNIRTGLYATDFLNPDCVTVPAGEAPIVLEVKWDAFLPDIVRAAVQTPGVRAEAFSKYAQCRIYG